LSARDGRLRERNWWEAEERGGDVDIVAILEAAMICDLRGRAIYENFLPSVNQVCTICAVFL